MNSEAVAEVPDLQLPGTPGVVAQQVRNQFVTAVSVQKPRALKRVEAQLLEEARLAGEDFYYGWGAGKDKIEGPSVELAVAAARVWGNCGVDALPVQELADAWVFTAAFIDLETGFTMTRQFRQSKRWVVHGKLDPERKDDVRFQIGQSKAARNVILKSLPAWLVNKAMDAAKAGVREKLEQYVKANGLAAAVDLLFKSLAKHGVKEERILAKVGVADRKGVDIDALVRLRGDLDALDKGKDRPDELFPEQRAEELAKKLPAAPEGGKPEDPKPGGGLYAGSGNLDSLKK